MRYVKFFGSNGSYGTEYKYYEAFPNCITETDIDEVSFSYAYENAESYGYLCRGWDSDWESEEEREEYYNNAISYCGWDYCSKEEYERNCE